MVLKRTQRHVWIVTVALCLVANSEAFAQQWGPLITTEWGQGGRYNNKVPYVIPFVPGVRRPVGCVATAMTQIINYWAYPSEVSFDSQPWPEGDAYTENGISFDADASKYGFPTFDELELSLSGINYDDDDDDEVAYLNFASGIKVQMSYGSMSSGAYMGAAASALKYDFSFGSVDAKSSYLGLWNDYRSVAIENIIKGWPVQIGVIENLDSKSGHSVVVDGYNSDTGEFHVNCGWNGDGNGWYDLPHLNTTTNGGYYDYEIVQTIVYNIFPNQGWSQWGADAQNSKSTKYTAPTSDPPINKWQLTCSSDYSFNGLVVGTGNKIYVSCEPYDQTGGYHPSIWVIDQYGDKNSKKEIVLDNEIEGLGYPAQSASSSTNTKPYVFVPTDSGKIYRIDTKDNSKTMIFQDSGLEELGSPIKIDENGYLYVNTNSRLYCLYQNGTARWSYPLPSNSLFFYGPCAIDTERNYVYFPFYNMTTKNSYMVCLNRSNGAYVNQIVYSNTAHAGLGTKSPTVGSDGTVYYSHRNPTTELVAYSPGLSSKLWGHTYTGGVNNIAVTGEKVYADYWTGDTSNPTCHIGAFNPGNGNNLWEIDLSHIEWSSGGGISTMYVSSNNVIAWTESRWDANNSTYYYRLCAYRDLGNDFESLWSMDLGTGGANIAFGPGATFYKAGGQTIFALSEGDIGDPDGAGMGFSDNAAPLMPSNPNPVDAAQDVDLSLSVSWACTDPESNAIKYSVFVGESGYDMVPVASDITSTSYALSDLEADTGYAWKVISTDGQAVTEGPTWVFSTKGLTVGFASDNSSGAESASPVTLAVNLSESSAQTVTVDYSVTGGTATGGGVDYTLASGTLSFSPGDTTENVQITVVDDLLGEADETIVITLSNPTNATLGTNASHSYTIIGAPIVQDTLTISSTSGGLVTNPGEGTHSYDDGTVVSIQATAAANYHFVNWTGTAVDAGKVADPGSASTTVTADADYTLQANFSIDQHNLTTSSTSGGTVATPGEGTYAYDHGAVASVAASSSANYHFVNWTGTAVDAGKVANASAASTTVTMDGSYTIHANFAVDQHTLTISSTSGGSVSSPGEGPFEYDSGTDVSIQATPADDYYFQNWTGTAVTAGKVANPNAAGTTVTVDASYTVQANFDQQDGVAPTIGNLSPRDGSIQAPLDSLMILHITDAGMGVDGETVEITLDGAIIYTGDMSAYNSATGTCRRTGTPADYRYAYQSDLPFYFDQIKAITVNASDVGGVAMDEQSYSFRTEMRSFGENKQVSVGLVNLNNERAATACDSSGNIWAVWHAGAAGSRDIYLGKLTAGADSFGASVRLTTNGSDQVNPALALGPDDKLYVVWQDNRRGNWDVFGSTSTNGTSWSTEQRIADLDDNDNYNQTNPAIVVDSNSPNNNAHVVWQDDRAGNQDIYIARSSSNFVTKDMSPITSDTSNQTGPAIAVNSSNVVYVLWTDDRNTTTGADIYGAFGPSWTNVGVVRKAASQSDPLIAVESAGSVLHILWVDDTSGYGDIYYASSSGLPATPLAGGNIVDDTLGADQLSPTLAVTGTGGGLKVFACWHDERNVSGSTGDVDLYMVQTNSGSGTNLFVGDGGTNSDQTEPAIGVDRNGYPYVVWTDYRGTNAAIYYAASNYVQSPALVSGLIDASSGGTIGAADVQSITDVDDVSIAVPAGGCPYDVTISVTRVENPPEFSLPILNGYDFSPSGLEFTAPVTIIIPFAVTGAPGVPTPYWYDSLTALLSQEGISNVEIIEISSSLHALRFTTTHLTPYYALLGVEPDDPDEPDEPDDTGGGGGGGGGGGCGLSPNHEGSAIEYLLPYIFYFGVLLIVKWKDARHRGN